MARATTVLISLAPDALADRAFCLHIIAESHLSLYVETGNKEAGIAASFASVEASQAAFDDPAPRATEAIACTKELYFSGLMRLAAQLSDCSRPTEELALLEKRLFLPKKMARTHPIRRLCCRHGKKQFLPKAVRDGPGVLSQDGGCFARQLWRLHP